MSDESLGDYVPLAPIVIAAYLEAYGYIATDSLTWRTRPGTQAAMCAGTPALHLQVVGHEEVDGHTHYIAACSLIGALARTEWSSKRRLVSIRENIHDAFKHVLDEHYSMHFAATPFAHKGGVPGTTSRLDNWFKACAICINAGSAQPFLVALVLHYLEAPEPARCSDLERSLALPVIASQSAGLSSPASKQLSRDDRPPQSPGACEIGSFEDIEVDLPDTGAGEDEELAGKMNHDYGDGLVLRFRLPDASERLVDFGRQLPPLGVDFVRSIPLQVSRSSGLAEVLGIRVGWVLMAVNGTNVETWLPTDAFRLMMALAQGDPTQKQASETSRSSGRISNRFKQESVRPRVILGFATSDGTEFSVDFGHHAPPLGLTFKGDAPVLIGAVDASSPAQAMGVKEGWVVGSVNGVPVPDKASLELVCKRFFAF